MASSSLPSRSTTMRSDDAQTPDDPISTSGILLERLQAWKHLCGYLENYVSSTEKLQKAQSKEYEKVLKSISDPLREGHHFDQSVGGMAGLFENIRSNTQSIANMHLDTEKNLKASVLPILERLHAEIKNKSKELSGGAAKGSKMVEKARIDTQNHIEMLGQFSASQESAGGRVDASKDPYVLKRGIHHRLNKQIVEENNNRQDLLNVQDNFLTFEGHIIQTIEKAIAAFSQTMGGQADRVKLVYGDMLGTAQKIPIDFEWKGFVNRNSNALLDPNVPPRSMDAVSFPNQDHKSTVPLIEGSLERKSRMALKGYNTSYYVVTPGKFLHEYKDTDDYRKDPTPDLSLYLPDCTVGGINGNKFSVKGKNVSGGKVGNALSTSSELDFKAHTTGDAEKWWNVIRSAAGATSAELPPSSEPSSPADRRTASGTSEPPAYDSHEPKPTLDTKNLPQPAETGTTSTSAGVVESPAGVTPSSVKSPALAAATAASSSSPSTSSPAGAVKFTPTK